MLSCSPLPFGVVGCDGFALSLLHLKEDSGPPLVHHLHTDGRVEDAAGHYRFPKGIDEEVQAHLAELLYLPSLVGKASVACDIGLEQALGALVRRASNRKPSAINWQGRGGVVRPGRAIMPTCANLFNERVCRLSVGRAQ